MRVFSAIFLLSMCAIASGINDGDRKSSLTSTSTQVNLHDAIYSIINQKLRQETGSPILSVRADHVKRAVNVIIRAVEEQIA